MKKHLFIIVFLLLCNACSESPEVNFERDGISIIVPEGWELSDSTPIDTMGYTLFIEKKGLDASGVIVISWLNFEHDIPEWIEDYKAELRGNAIYKSSNITFSIPIDSSFNRSPSKAVSFKLELLGMKHEGIIHFFYKGGKTFSIMRQEATEDKQKNKYGFARLEGSFNVLTAEKNE